MSKVTLSFDSFSLSGKMEECQDFFKTLYSFIYFLGTYLKPHVSIWTQNYFLIMVHYNHLDLAPEFVFFFANRLPFLMVLLWVVEEVFRFLEHFALQLIEQYVNIFHLIYFFSIYFRGEIIFAILPWCLLYFMNSLKSEIWFICYNTTIFRSLQLQKFILDSILMLQPPFTCRI